MERIRLKDITEVLQGPGQPAGAGWLCLPSRSVLLQSCWLPRRSLEQWDKAGTAPGVLAGKPSRLVATRSGQGFGFGAAPQPGHRRPLSLCFLLAPFQRLPQGPLRAAAGPLRRRAAPEANLCPTAARRPRGLSRPLRPRPTRALALPIEPGDFAVPPRWAEAGARAAGSEPGGGARCRDLLFLPPRAASFYSDAARLSQPAAGSQPVAVTPAAEAEGRAASWAAPLQVGTGCGLRGAAPGGALRDGAVAAPCVGRSAAGLCARSAAPRESWGPGAPSPPFHCVPGSREAVPRGSCA